MDYSTRYARWLRFWYTKASLPYFLISAMINLMPPPRTPAARSFDGFRMLLNPRDLLQTALLLEGRWEETVEHWIKQMTRGATTVFDVGAHVGYFTLTAWATAPKSAQIIAFEPNTSSRTQLEANVTANAATNITVIPAAVGAAPGTMMLYPATMWEPGATSGYRAHNNHGFEVPVLTLETFRKEHGIQRVDALKMDTEGAEDAILIGMHEGLEQGCYRAMLIALHPHLWSNPKSTEDRIRGLSDLGYELFLVDGPRAKPLGNQPLPDTEILIVHRDHVAEIVRA